jgi:hypothetical protein
MTLAKLRHTKIMKTILSLPSGCPSFLPTLLMNK